MAQAHFSQKYWAVQKRVQKLPQMMVDHMKARAKKHATGVIKEFQDGIRDRSLRLRKLKTGTVASKRARSLDLPDNPLYALGDSEPNSYINMMEVVNVGDRIYSVRPKNEKHHGKRKPEDKPSKNRIKLKDLFEIHEYGATIVNAFGVPGRVVTIPPRPAFRYAYKRYMRKMASADPVAAVQAAIAKYIRHGDAVALDRIRKKMLIGFNTLKGIR